MTDKSDEFPIKPSKGRREIAEYRETLNPEHQGNPLIEALPSVLDRAMASKALIHHPKYECAYRQLPMHERLQLLRTASRFIAVLPIHLDLYYRIACMIREGYADRNPLKRGFFPQIHSQIEAFVSADSHRELEWSTAYGFTILGFSGVGKTTALNTILSLYPQVIFHNHYRRQDFSFTQVVYLKLDCPFDGSIKGLCFSFFVAMDRLLGTSYYDRYTKGHTVTTDRLMEDMARIAALHGLGVLVIDEIQFLREAKNGGSRKMLNFFTNLVNKIRLPVVLVGTNKAHEVIATDFSQTRRGTGQGDLEWKPMKKGKVWNLFLKSLWKYQYTTTPCDLTSSMSSAIFEVSAGITDFAVKAYIEAQKYAILNGVEKITPSIIRAAAAESFRLANPILSAIRQGTERARIELRVQVEDITPIPSEPALDRVADEVRAELQSTKQNNLSSKVLSEERGSEEREEPQ